MNIGLTLLGQMITFAIFVWFTMKFIWPVLEQALDERRKKIIDGLAAAEKGQQILITAADQVKEELRQARERGNDIIAAANKQARQILETAKSEAMHERDNILAAGRDMVKHELTEARNILQTKIADIVVLGAEKILVRSINVADHKDILDKLALEMVG